MCINVTFRKTFFELMHLIDILIPCFFLNHHYFLPLICPFQIGASYVFLFPFGIGGLSDLAYFCRDDELDVVGCHELVLLQLVELFLFRVRANHEFKVSTILLKFCYTLRLNSNWYYPILN